MIGVGVRGADKVLAKLKGAVVDLKGETDRAMRDAVKEVRRRLALEMTGPEVRDSFWGKKGAAGNKLSVRSGATRASLTAGSRIYRTGTTVVGVVGSASKSLKLHEDGATISGTSPKGYLRIPTAAAQTRAGVDRNTGRSVKDIPGAFLFRSKAGNLWAAVRKGKRGVLTLLYLFKKSVRLRPRRIFARVRDESQPVIIELTRGHVNAVVRKANS